MGGCHRIEIGNGSRWTYNYKIPSADCVAISLQTPNMEDTGYIIMLAFGSFLLVFFSWLKMA
jgi:hypothetical protein